MKTPHTVTARELRNYQNGLYLAWSWAEDAYIKATNGKAEEAGYSARCAAHIGNLLPRLDAMERRREAARE